VLVILYISGTNAEKVAERDRITAANKVNYFLLWQEKHTDTCIRTRTSSSSHFMTDMRKSKNGIKPK
jgi:hypothetical protein